MHLEEEKDSFLSIYILYKGNKALIIIDHFGLRL
jgi:hypothetical protein